MCAGRQWLAGAWLPSRLAVVRVEGSCVGRTVVGPSAPLPWAKPRSWYVLRAARCVWTGEGRRPCRAHRGGTKDLPQHRLRWLSSCNYLLQIVSYPKSVGISLLITIHSKLGFSDTIDQKIFLRIIDFRFSDFQNFQNLKIGKFFR